MHKTWIGNEKTYEYRVTQLKEYRVSQLKEKQTCDPISTLK